jgi:hypothetical protein
MLPSVKQRLLVLGSVIVACSSPQADVERPVATSEVTVAPVDAEATGTVRSTSILPTSTVAPVAKPAMEARFLPLDHRCEKDADCAVTKRGVQETLFCCDACGAVAGTKAWVARADLRCSVYDKEPAQHACPPRDCGPPGAARCNHGSCEIVP